MDKERIYFCIDMKSFFASVECAERGLDPLQTNLVVADESRARGALCLAVSPKMKNLGVKNRCRLFQISEDIEYIIAKPRMRKYIEYAADIYAIYLKYIDKNDIHVYSIDESFIDVTDYLKIYDLTPTAFASKLLEEIWTVKKIPATAGIGTNLYLAKIALDITAKVSKDRIGVLNEKIYKETLWQHKPITDFWQVAKGIANRLERMGVRTMYELTRYPEQLLYKEFGVNAELLIDHAWGKESCTMQDIKNYKGKSQSVSSSQILFEDYSFDKAKIVVAEMVRDGAYELMRRGVITNRFNLFIGYSDDSLPTTKIHVKMSENTNLSAVISKYAMNGLEKSIKKNSLIRKIGIEFIDVYPEDDESYDLFTDYYKIKKEKNAEKTALKIKDKFGKNAIVRAADLQDGATAIERNKLIGGHNGE